MLATYIGFEPIDIYSDSVATTPSSLVGLNLLVPGTGVEPAKVSVLNAVAVPICIHHPGIVYGFFPTICSITSELPPAYFSVIGGAKYLHL